MKTQLNPSLPKLHMKVLEHTFKDSMTPELLNALVDIIAATPSPETALELLCGIYEEPEIAEFSLYNDRIHKFVSYDKFNKQINCEYLDPEKKGHYFPEGTKREDITLDNYQSLVESPAKDSSVWYSITTDKYIKKSTYIDLDIWNKRAVETKGAEIWTDLLTKCVESNVQR